MSSRYDKQQQRDAMRDLDLEVQEARAQIDAHNEIAIPLAREKQRQNSRRSVFPTDVDPKAGPSELLIDVHPHQKEVAEHIANAQIDAPGRSHFEGQEPKTPRPLGAPLVLDPEYMPRLIGESRKKFSLGGLVKDFFSSGAEYVSNLSTLASQRIRNGVSRISYARQDSDEIQATLVQSALLMPHVDVDSTPPSQEELFELGSALEHAAEASAVSELHDQAVEQGSYVSSTPNSPQQKKGMLLYSTEDEGQARVVSHPAAVQEIPMYVQTPEPIKQDVVEEKPSGLDNLVQAVRESYAAHTQHKKPLEQSGADFEFGDLESSEGAQQEFPFGDEHIPVSQRVPANAQSDNVLEWGVSPKSLNSTEDESQARVVSQQEFPFGDERVPVSQHVVDYRYVAPEQARALLREVYGKDPDDIPPEVAAKIDDSSIAAQENATKGTRERIPDSLNQVMIVSAEEREAAFARIKKEKEEREQKKFSTRFQKGYLAFAQDLDEKMERAYTSLSSGLAAVKENLLVDMQDIKQGTKDLASRIKEYTSQKNAQANTWLRQNTELARKATLGIVAASALAATVSFVYNQKNTQDALVQESTQTTQVDKGLDIAPTKLVTASDITQNNAPVVSLNKSLDEIFAQGGFETYSTNSTAVLPSERLEELQIHTTMQSHFDSSFMWKSEYAQANLDSITFDVEAKRGDSLTKILRAHNVPLNYFASAIKATGVENNIKDSLSYVRDPVSGRMTLVNKPDGLPDDIQAGKTYTIVVPLKEQAANSLQTTAYDAQNTSLQDVMFDVAPSIPATSKSSLVEQVPVEQAPSGVSYVAADLQQCIQEKGFPLQNTQNAQYSRALINASSRTPLYEGKGFAFVLPKTASQKEVYVDSDANGSLDLWMPLESSVPELQGATLFDIVANTKLLADYYLKTLPLQIENQQAELSQNFRPGQYVGANAFYGSLLKQLDCPVSVTYGDKKDNELWDGRIERRRPGYKS